MATKGAIDISRRKGYKRVTEITNRPTKEVDSETGEKLTKIYLTVKFIPEFSTTEEPEEYFFNERSTPKELKTHWFNFKDRRKTALKDIRKKMDRYFIDKEEIK